MQNPTDLQCMQEATDPELLPADAGCRSQHVPTSCAWMQRLIKLPLNPIPTQC